MFSFSKPKLKQNAVPTLSYKDLAKVEGAHDVSDRKLRSAYRKRLCNEVS